ncbi:hypothetical protein BJV77DRAFT_462889 [Russula vinacea]|nr:hypothetical protein BJV77DRAFT_462889 [Russula vinacea]
MLDFILSLVTTFQLRIVDAKRPSTRMVYVIISLDHGLPILHLSCSPPRLLDRNPDHLLRQHVSFTSLPLTSHLYVATTTFDALVRAPPPATMADAVPASATGRNTVVVIASNMVLRLL